MSWCAECSESPTASSSHPACPSQAALSGAPAFALLGQAAPRPFLCRNPLFRGCRAVGVQSAAACCSIPATARSPQPLAQAQPAQQLGSPCTPLTQQREPGLHCAAASTLLLPGSPCGGRRQELPLPAAEEGPEQVLTLWLLQCVTVAWFSERQGRRAPSALQSLSRHPQGGHRELVPCAPCTLFCRGCLHPSPSPPPAGAPPPVLGDTGHILLAWDTALSVLLPALPAGWLLRSGALAALPVADVLAYLVDFPVPAHTGKGQVVGSNRDRSAFECKGAVWGSPPFLQAAVAGHGRTRAEPAVPKG